MAITFVIRGGGDLASGAALRLHRAGLSVIILELPEPLAVRRTVSFANGIFEGRVTIEDVAARLVSPDQYQTALEAGVIPLIVDPEANLLKNPMRISPSSTIVVDARMLKQPPDLLPIKPLMYIGLGPGFAAGENCDVVIETKRGHTMGRLVWHGESEADSMKPDGDERRVLRAPRDGTLTSNARIGDHFDNGESIASIDDEAIPAPFSGILRGLLRPGVKASKGMKVGDLDPRNDPALCELVSDKALAVGGAVLEAILTIPAVREKLWE